MPTTDERHVVVKCKRIVVEVRQRVGAATHRELAGDEIQPGRLALIQIHAKRGRIDVAGVVTAVVQTP